MKIEAFGPSLLAAFARVPDVRSRHGRCYSLPALLTLATAAMLAVARSLYAIVQWGQLQPAEVQRALGFTRGRVSAVTTLHYSFKRLDVLAFESGAAGVCSPGAERSRPARGARWQGATWSAWG